MNKNPPYEPHLVVKEVRLAKGGEWRPDFRGWCLSQTGSGISYWKELTGMREVSVGSVLVFPAGAEGYFRASQLNEVTVTYFCVEVEKLLGLLTIREQQFLAQAARRGNQAVRLFPSPGLIPDGIKNLHVNPAAGTSARRLRLLQIFLDIFEMEIDRDASSTTPWVDGRGRLRQIMNQMAASEFAEMSISELAPKVPCSPRHLNRLFREELGASFREKQIEVRLARACVLLSTSDAKVVDVAMESGYQSSSVFSGLFKKHLGLSPGKWRRQGLKLTTASRSP